MGLNVSFGKRENQKPDQLQPDQPAPSKGRGFKFDAVFIFLIPNIFLTFLILYFIVSFNDTLGIIPSKDTLTMAQAANVLAYCAAMAFGACIASLVSLWCNITLIYRVVSTETKTIALTEKVDEMTIAVENFADAVDTYTAKMKSQQVSSQVPPQVKKPAEKVIRHVVEEPTEDAGDELPAEDESINEQPIPIAPKKVAKSTAVVTQIKSDAQKPLKASTIKLPLDPKKKRESRVIKDE